MNLRTDLALERGEMLGKRLPDGVRCEICEKGTAKITKIEVCDENGANAIGKPVGRYITVEVPPFTKNAPLSEEETDLIADGLRELLPKGGAVLVAGLGNADITPDALGPKCSELIFATRHISREISEATGLGNLRPVVNLIPGVLGNTGIETGEIILGVVKAIKPSAVITVDALAARKMSRLGCTVQISDTGVTPGSGVGNARTEINESFLGVPVIAVGVPTVVDAATLAYDLTGGENGKIIMEPEGESMMITPREIDLVIERASALVAMAINRALQPHISREDLLMLVT